MEKFVRTYWKTLLFFALVGLFGGFFTGLYMLDSYPEEMRQEILAQGITAPILGLVTAVQSAGYGLALGAAGIFLGKKIGLWKDETTLTKKPLTISVFGGIFGGLAMILPDMLLFGKYSEAVASSYAVKPTVSYMLAAVAYGAVIEEVMLRLFFLSLIAFVLHKLLGKNAQPAVPVLIAANVIAALLFAAGHLPATFQLMGNAPILIVRCFLLNGGLGLLFGYLYRKYGLRYAMIAHGGCHVVSKLIWILFI